MVERYEQAVARRRNQLHELKRAVRAHLMRRHAIDRAARQRAEEGRRTTGRGSYRGMASWSEDERSWYRRDMKLIRQAARKAGLTDNDLTTLFQSVHLSLMEEKEG